MAATAGLWWCTNKITEPYPSTMANYKSGYCWYIETYVWFRMAGAIIKQYVFINPSKLKQMRTLRKRAGNRSTFVQNVEFANSEFSSSWSMRLEESTSNVSRYCFRMGGFAEIFGGNFCLDPVGDILLCNLMRMFLNACWRGCLLVRFHIWRAERSDWTVEEFGGAASRGTAVENA